ncbi:MAG TPA: heparin lyase I family protein [Polyangia bacterium]|nr:heparin lyase I family protein [Polyangia bacterium]
MVIASLLALGCRHARPSAPVPPAVPESPRWRGDLETGDLSQWGYLLNPRGISVVGAPVIEGRHAARIEIQRGDLWPNGLNRVELQHKPPPEVLAEGQRSCFAWSFFVPVALAETRHQIGYWESYPSYQQVMSFEVTGQTIRFVTRMPTEKVHWTATGGATPNVWHRLALCARWSAEPAVGRVDVWFDGRPVVVDVPAHTRAPGNDPNLVQLGILRDGPDETELMFVDAALEGPSTQAVRAVDPTLFMR